MEHSYGLQGFGVPFGIFAEKVMREFKLVAEGGKFPAHRISAHVNMNNYYLSRFQVDGNQKVQKEVAVLLRLSYKNKHLTFSHPFTFAELDDKLDDWGMIENAQDLIVRPETLKLVIGRHQTDYNYGKQADGQDFDGNNFVRKIFKQCKGDGQIHSSKSVVDSIRKDDGKGGK